MYLLDTNVLSEVLRPRPNVAVVRRLFSTSPSALFASEMSRYELRYGAALHPRPEAIWSKVAHEILPLPLWLPIDEATALAAGNLRGELRRAGKPIEVPACEGASRNPKPSRVGAAHASPGHGGRGWTTAGRRRSPAVNPGAA